MSEAYEIVFPYVKRFEKQSWNTIALIQSDNGTEFSRTFTSVTDDGFICATSTPDALECTTLAERTRHIIMNDVRSCLTQAHLPNSFGITSYNT